MHTFFLVIQKIAIIMFLSKCLDHLNWSVEEILTICHVSRPLIGTIVGVVSRVQSALYTYLISHNKTNNTCCYGTSQFVIRNNWQKII